MQNLQGLNFWVERATKEDVASLFQLLHFKTSNELLMPLSAKDLAMQVENFFVARSYLRTKISSSSFSGTASVVGCCAYLNVRVLPAQLENIESDAWREKTFYELRSVAVDARFQSCGIGRSLVAFAERTTVKKIVSASLEKGSAAGLLTGEPHAKKIPRELIGFCFSKRSSFFEKLGYVLSSWNNFPLSASSNPRYDKARGKSGVKLYSKKIPISL